MEIIAYHEAGHALMAWYLGARVHSVTIDPDRDDGPHRSGDTRVAWRRADLGERAFREKAIQVALAGPVAEMLYSGDPFHPGLVAEWSADWEDAWAMAEMLQALPEKRMAYLEQVSIRLYRVLNSEPFWPALAELADHLLAHETLESDQVEEIVQTWF